MRPAGTREEVVLNAYAYVVVSTSLSVGHVTPVKRPCPLSRQLDGTGHWCPGQSTLTGYCGTHGSRSPSSAMYDTLVYIFISQRVYGHAAFTSQGLPPRRVTQLCVSGAC